MTGLLKYDFDKSCCIEKKTEHPQKNITKTRKPERKKTRGGNDRILEWWRNGKKLEQKRSLRALQRIPEGLRRKELYF
jgi:hypothetical protein